MKKKTTAKAKSSEDQRYELACESALAVEKAGMALPLPEYIDYLDSVIDLLGDFKNNAEADLKRQDT
jgi:hypothetical protein